MSFRHCAFATLQTCIVLLALVGAVLPAQAEDQPAAVGEAILRDLLDLVVSEEMTFGAVAVQSVNGGFALSFDSVTVTGADQAPLDLGAMGITIWPEGEGRYRYGKVVLPAKLELPDSLGVMITTVSFAVERAEGLWDEESQDSIQADIRIKNIQIGLERDDIQVSIAAATIFADEETVGGRTNGTNSMEISGVVLRSEGVLMRLDRLVFALWGLGDDKTATDHEQKLLRDLKAAARQNDRATAERLIAQLQDWPVMDGVQQTMMIGSDGFYLASDLLNSKERLQSFTLHITAYQPDPESDQMALAGGMEIHGATNDPGTPFGRLFARLMPNDWHLPIEMTGISQAALSRLVMHFLIKLRLDDADENPGPAVMPKVEFPHESLRGATFAIPDATITSDVGQSLLRGSFIYNDTSARKLAGTLTLDFAGLDAWIDILAHPDAPGDWAAAESFLQFVKYLAIPSRDAAGNPLSLFTLIAPPEGPVKINGHELP